MDNSTTSNILHPLVTQTLIQTSKFFCPFLERGFCRDSSRCNFSHDTIKAIKIPTDYCHFYLANQCLYGQDCKFRHSEPSRPPAGPSSRVASSIVTLLAAASSSSSSYMSNSSSSSNHNSNSSSSLSATSYAKACKGDATTADTEQPTASDHDPRGEQPLCPFASASGECPYPNGQCTYVHGLDCDLCGRACLHPFDLDQQLQHREDCLREHEREMELSFAIQRSKDKVCGICMDTVVEKLPITSSRFGILEKCNHIFCLDCIRKWRGTKQFETRTIRACPECRVSSDFVVPSKYWIEDQDDKDKLICDYKAALKSKPCKYFDEGKGDCPFAGSCFYRHAYPDGRLATEDPPKPRRRLFGARGATSTVANYILWNILASTDDDDWSGDELESLYNDPAYRTDDENSNDDWLEYE